MNPKNQTKKAAAAVALALLMSATAWAQTPVTGYACERPQDVVLLHGSFLTITNNWPDMIAGLSKTRKVVAVEMQGDGRTADIKRDLLR